MARTSDREKVQELRRSGLSIRSIADKTSVSKSTVSYWCRDIILTRSQMRALIESEKRGRIRGLLQAAEKKRARRLQDTATEAQKGKRDVGAINKRDLFMIGIALYWGEGYKKGSDELGFTNSDPRIIRVFITWLRTCYGAQSEDLIARVSINAAHAHRESKVVRFWSEVTNIPLRQFTKTSFIKAKLRKNYKDQDVHFGTLRIKLRRGSALRRRILGSIEAVAAETN